MNEVITRVERTFSNQRYKDRLSKSRKNWLDKSVEIVFKEIKVFLSECN